MPANDIQVGGDHYKRIGGEQHWDRAIRLKFDIFQYQVTKYVERWKDKNGVEDLEKARHFLDKYIEEHRKFGLSEGLVGVTQQPSPIVSQPFTLASDIKKKKK